MKLFFRFALCYFLFAFAVTAAVRQAGTELFLEALIATYAFATVIARAAVLMIPLFIAIPFIMGWRRFLANLPLIGYAVAGSAILQTAFSFLKSSIPLIVPFYADPPFAAFDRWLHGGIDPWILTHDLGAMLPMDRLLPLYLSVWAIPAISLPLILAVTDRNAERKARFLVLYLGCWLILGNVIALAASSVGPVYYDALLGGDRFATLQLALEDTGLKETRIGAVQGYLWAAYAERGIALGSGISAFPSVHVGIATITALYLAERSRWLILPGFAFLAAIGFLSVYTGYHYAIDGYFSVLFIAGLWYALRRMRLTELGAPGDWLKARARTAEVRADMR